jgi:uncharacterized SAM-binding protein YcdF (DUF218 family)
MSEEVDSSKMERETLKSRVQEILSGRGEAVSSPTSSERKYDSHYGHGDSGEGMTGPGSGKPIEPESPKAAGIARLKWLFFVLALLYVLVSAYHGVILTSLGRYLVVSHPPEKSDLIVCLGGASVERGLAAADAFHRGLAPRIFVAREIMPAGLDILRQRGVSYPESRERMIMMLKGLGVPEPAILTLDTASEGTVMEASLLRKLVSEEGYRSIILVTSPSHSRRAWLVFKKALAKEDVRVAVIPSPYSNYNPEAWWKNPRDFRQVVLEYQKLVYSLFKGYL